ncbi:MAG: ABC transporter permease [Gammaproteobacteria bacterium]|nr:ABC transporter permease [Gammaproteobacteria bacterium]
MFWNNVKIALRNLRKNKVFALVNILGLALGLTIYVFGGLLVKYENTHDMFFENAANTYTIGSVAAPDLNVGVERFNATFTTVGPIIEAELQDVQKVARTVPTEFLLSVGDKSFYESVNFSDAALLDIFDFNYIHGDATALQDPSGLVLNESSAIKYFGHTDVINETITFDNEFDFHVTGVIADVPLNSHFSSSVIGESGLNFIAPISGLNRMRDWDLAGNWNNLSIGNLTYVLLPETLGEEWLATQVEGIFDRLVPDEQKQVLSALTVTPLQRANLAVWDMIGMPVIAVVSLLSFLVLIVACVNYTNLATAQSLGRSREVGMRKTMGASQLQLLAQFLIESLVIASLAMIVAIAALELMIPLFNNLANKSLTLDYVKTLPWLVLTTVLVGLIAGMYPAWLITRTNPIDALRDLARKGKRGARMRSIMIGGQFAISAFMLSVVSIVFMQNEKVKESSYIFPRSEIYTMDRLFVEGIRDRLDTLKYELEAIPNVATVSYSSQVPYEQNNSQRSVSLQPGDESGQVNLHTMDMSPDFLRTYDIPLLEGRQLDRNMAQDLFKEDAESLNVIINELAVESLQFGTPADAINQRFYRLDDDGNATEYIVVGVVPTQNIVGLFNEVKPWMFTYDPESVRIGSIRITGGNIMDTVEEIEAAWKRVVPEYPLQGQFLDGVFDDVYNILKYMNMALAGFAFVALALASVGLFGLAAFMAAQRTKEIGMRKVLGASTAQIARLLVWQFSTPVLWALAVALPAAYFASIQYLNFFAERIESPVLVLIVAGALAVTLAWSTVAGHAIRIARSNPIMALRYE